MRSDARLIHGGVAGQAEEPRERDEDGEHDGRGRAAEPDGGQRRGETAVDPRCVDSRCVQEIQVDEAQQDHDPVADRDQQQEAEQRRREGQRGIEKTGHRPSPPSVVAVTESRSVDTVGRLRVGYG